MNLGSLHCLIEIMDILPTLLHFVLVRMEWCDVLIRGDCLHCFPGIVRWLRGVMHMKCTMEGQRRGDEEIHMEKVRRKDKVESAYWGSYPYRWFVGDKEQELTVKFWNAGPAFQNLHCRGCVGGRRIWVIFKYY